jgi:RimJ/RimL family protein N-acetyltransferase
MPIDMMPIKISSAKTPAQIIEVADLANTIWTEHFTPLIGSAQVYYMLEKFQSVAAITNQIHEGYRYFLIKLGDESIGYTAIHAEPEKNSLFLSKIYVVKTCRGRHIATKTISFIKELCKKEGLHKIWLTVNKGNLSSIKVYEHLGFIKVRDVVTDIGEGYVMDDHIMEMTV